MLFVQFLTVLGGLASAVHALPKVTRGGRYLYQEDGTRFFIKGIAYQEQGTQGNDANNGFQEPTDFVDPLADSQSCTRDVPFLKQLGVNAIRVYSVDSSRNHDSCMQLLENAGIYTIIDLSLPVNGSIDRSAPSWTTNILDLYLNTVNTFLKYENVLAFNIGNEVVAQADILPNVTAASPYIKAAARDVKAFLKSKSSNVLVGYASTDGPSTWLEPLANYLSCDSDATSIDLYGLNNYEWCGDSSFESSYAGTNSNFANYNIPAYFSEFGCVTSPPRLWTEVAALFGPEMTPNWSGGLAFSYFPAVNDQGNFGMVTIGGADNQTVTLSNDFQLLKAQYGNVTFTNSPSKADAGETQFPACAGPTDTFLASNTLPPTPNDAACQCLREKASSCVFKETNNANEAAIIGTLTDTACSLFGQQGGSCSPIGGSGSSGEYGAVSFCDPVTKLDYVFSAFYELTKRNPQSCDFSGNATVVPTAPSASALAAAATSCLSNAQATFTPTTPSGGSNSGGKSSSSGTGGSPSQTNGAATSLAILAETQGALGFGLMFLLAFSGGFYTLLT